MPLLTTDDFRTGFHALPLDKYNQLQSYIDKFEPLILCQLFGSELYDLYVADLVDGVPQSPRFLEVFNPFCKTVQIKYCCWKGIWEYDYESRWCEELLQSEGIKEMLKGFIYFNYLPQLGNQQTPVGLTRKKVAASDMLSDKQVGRDAEQKLNQAIISYQAIQKFMCYNHDVYPEFDGQAKGYSYSSVI